MKRNRLLLFGMLMLANILGAQVPTLVKDIKPGGGSSLQFYERGLFSFGDQLLFAADDGLNGIELWISDGTPQGTTLLKDIYPGSIGSTSKNFFQVGNGKVLFQASHPSYGLELWVTDGTEAGTQLVKDIRPGTASSLLEHVSVQSYYYVWNDVLYFSADDGITGFDFWRSDGTEAGTYLLKDINPGFPGSGGNSNPRNYATYDDKLYFSAFENSNEGEQLWVSDGTEGGTMRFYTFPKQSGGSNPGDKLSVNGRLIFYVETDAYGSELWATDGTPNGTYLVKDINPGVEDSDNTQPNTFEPWLKKVGDVAYFGADDGTHGRELWRTDGTEQGTYLVKDISTNQPGYTPQLFAIIDDKMYYKYDDGIHGTELWRSDGTAAGTYMLKDVLQGSTGSWWGANFMQAFNHKLYFGGAKGSAFNMELWVSDGTEAGTVALADINPGSGNGSDPGNFVLVGDMVLFAATTNAQGRELWSVESTSFFSTHNKLEGVSIFPTVGNGTFTLKTPENWIELKVEIFDQLGKPITKWENGYSGQQFDLTHFPKGIFMVRISKDGKSSTEKLIIQ